MQQESSIADRAVFIGNSSQPVNDKKNNIFLRPFMCSKRFSTGFIKIAWLSIGPTSCHLDGL